MRLLAESYQSVTVVSAKEDVLVPQREPHRSHQSLGDCDRLEEFNGGAESPNLHFGVLV